MARLRAGRANTARGAAHFLRETLSRVRHAGATGQLTVRADSGFYTHDIVTVCRKMDVASPHRPPAPSLRDLIEAIPEADSTPTLLDGGCSRRCRRPHSGVSLTHRCASSSDKPTPGSQASSPDSYHAFITDRATHWNWKPTTAARRDRERDPRPEVRCGTEPSALRALCRQRRLDGRAGTGPQLARGRPASVWGSGGDHQDPQTIVRHARTLHLPQRWPWQTQFGRALTIQIDKPPLRCAEGRSSSTTCTVAPSKKPRPRHCLRHNIQPAGLVASPQVGHVPQIHQAGPGAIHPSLCILNWSR